MLSKLTICTDSKEIYDRLFKLNWNFEKIEIIQCSIESFSKNRDFDIINIPTTFAEALGSKPLDLDCQILKTNKLYSWPEYIVTSPNFTEGFKKMHDYEMGMYQIEIPLKKVLNHFLNEKNEVSYAIHSEFAFGYFNKESIKFKEIQCLIESILENA